MPSIQTSKQTVQNPIAKPSIQTPPPAVPSAQTARLNLQKMMTQVSNPKISPEQLEEWKGHALQDQKLDQDEAKFLIDQMAAGHFSPQALPEVSKLLSSGYNAHTANPIAYIGGNKLSEIHRVDSSFTLDSAKQITDENGIDEIYFRAVNAKGELEGDLFVAYGSAEAKGALNLDHIKPGYVGRMDNTKIKVVHINNETNTILEGAKAPWVSAGHTLKDAGQTGIAKGIAEVATTVTALFIGKAVVENGVKSVTEKAAGTAVTVAGAASTAATSTAVAVAETVVAPVAEAVAAKGLPVVMQEARSLGSTIGSSVKSSLRSVAIGVAVAGAVVGTVVTIGSAIGMVKSRTNHRDYTTLDMVTGNY